MDIGGAQPRTDRAAGATALVSVSGGRPQEGWPEELAFLALVAAVRFPERPVPARVLGLWPDSGDHLVVEVDGAVLAGAAGRVVSTVADTADARAGRAGRMGNSVERDSVRREQGPGRPGVRLARRRQRDLVDQEELAGHLVAGDPGAAVVP